MRKIIVSIIAAALIMIQAGEVSAQAQSIKLEIGSGEDIRANLDKIDNKVITVVLNSDKEFTGKVYNVTDKLLHLIDLSGKDYYDAIIKIDSIQAIVVKARGN